MHSGQGAASLTRHLGKASDRGPLSPPSCDHGAYRAEPYYSEGRAALRRLLGDDFPSFMAEHCLLVIKPDGVRLGKVEAALAHCHAAGFTLVGGRIVHLDRNMWRALWMSRIVLLPTWRLRYNDLYGVGDCFVALLRGRPSRDSACQDLTAFKGSAFPDQRDDTTLRSLLGAPNRVMSLVHTSDEPADMVRELSVLFDENGISDLLQGGVPAVPDLPGATFEQQLNSAKRRLAEQTSCPDLLSVAQDPHLGFDAFMDRLGSEGVRLAGWDIALLWSHHIDDRGAVPS